MSKFLPFAEALAFARSLELVGHKGWQQWCKEGVRPPNVPSNPHTTYKDGGWQGWGHWLGTGNQANHTRQSLPFNEALAVACSLNLASKKEWRVWCKEGMCPPNVPSAPHHTYKDAGWQGWGHWLGTGNIRNTTQFLPFADALAAARSLELTSSTEWGQWCKEGMCPPNVPSNPQRTYKDGGWQGWGHWLGTGNVSSKVKKEQFLPFDEALRVARCLRLNSQQEWKLWCRSGARPANVPSRPDKAYVHDGWMGWVHWLDHGSVGAVALTSVGSTKACLPFADALVTARSLGLANRSEWREWCKKGMRPRGVPAGPDTSYKDDGWQGWGHWLGTGSHPRGQKKKFLPFDEALRVARALRLVSSTEWKLWCRSGARPTNVPAAPDQAYVHDGWMGWTHWLSHANLGAAAPPPDVPQPTRKRAAASACKGVERSHAGKRQRR